MRLEYGLGLEPENRAALKAGTRHHKRKAVAEWVTGGSIGLGRVLVVFAAVALLLLIWWSSLAFRPGGSPRRRC
jgi:hypothetical protein